MTSLPRNPALHLAYLGLGSNLGDRLAYIASALARLDAAPGVRLVATSGLYETEPWYVADQPAFVNACAAVETSLAPHALLALLLDTEQDLGRVREVPKGPRSIDLDILLYDDLVMDEVRDGQRLTIPHPGIPERPFVLVPLTDIAAEVVHPVSREKLRALRIACGDEGVRLLPSVILAEGGSRAAPEALSRNDGTPPRKG